MIGKIYIDCDNVMDEYVDKIIYINNEMYTNSLTLCNNNINSSIRAKTTKSNKLYY